MTTDPRLFKKATLMVCVCTMLALAGCGRFKLFSELNQNTAATNAASALFSVPPTLTAPVSPPVPFSLSTAMLFRDTTNSPINSTLRRLSLSGSAVTLAETQNWAIEASDFPAAAGDFWGDRGQEIFWRDLITGSWKILRMDGAQTGYLQNSQPSLATLGSNQVLLGVGDFDGDGKSDLLWQDSSTGLMNVWLMNGGQIKNEPGNSITFPTPVQEVASAPGPAVRRFIGIGDFLGGHQDSILFQDTLQQTLVLWTLTGSSFVESVITASVPPSARLAALADFDGSGKKSLILRDSITGGLTWVSFTASTSATLSPLSQKLAPTTDVLAAADFNGDGKADLLLRDYSSGNVFVWLLNGAQVLNPAVLAAGAQATYTFAAPNLGTSMRLLAATDLDGDGKADLMWESFGADGVNASLLIWKMNGAVIAQSNATASGSISQGWEMANSLNSLTGLPQATPLQGTYTVPHDSQLAFLEQSLERSPASGQIVIANSLYAPMSNPVGGFDIQAPATFSWLPAGLLILPPNTRMQMNAPLDGLTGATFDPTKNLKNQTLFAYENYQIDWGNINGASTSVARITFPLPTPISPRWFGATGDGVTNDHVAIQQASDAIEARGGGVLYFPYPTSGTYLVGLQRLNPAVPIPAGSPTTVSWQGNYLIYYKGLTSSVTITGELDPSGNRPTLKMVNGIRMEGFNPNTGLPDGPCGPSGCIDAPAYWDFCAQVVEALISVHGANQVTISNLRLDGNSANYILGAKSPTATSNGFMENGQCEDSGIYIFDTQSSIVSAVDSVDWGYDGLCIEDYTLSYADFLAGKSHANVVTGSHFDYNANGGLVYGNGTSLTVNDTSFNNTGQVPNMGCQPPCMGIDLEPQYQEYGDDPLMDVPLPPPPWDPSTVHNFIRGATFNNVQVENNGGPGIDCDGSLGTNDRGYAVFNNSTIIGQQNYALWGSCPGVFFNNSNLHGEIVHGTWPTRIDISTGRSEATPASEIESFNNSTLDDNGVSPGWLFNVNAPEAMNWINSQITSNIAQFWLEAAPQTVLMQNVNIYLKNPAYPNAGVVPVGQGWVGWIAGINPTNLNIYDETGLNGIPAIIYWDETGFYPSSQAKLINATGKPQGNIWVAGE